MSGQRSPCPVTRTTTPPLPASEGGGPCPVPRRAHTTGLTAGRMPGWTARRPDSGAAPGHAHAHWQRDAHKHRWMSTHSQIGSHAYTPLTQSATETRAHSRPLCLTRTPALQERTLPCGASVSTRGSWEPHRRQRRPSQARTAALALTLSVSHRVSPDRPFGQTDKQTESKTRGCGRSGPSHIIRTICHK